MFDSMKITRPVAHASSCARFAESTQWLSSRRRTKPRTPPDTSTVAISAPITRVNMIVRASPSPPSTSTVPWIPDASPAKGFHPWRIV